MCKERPHENLEYNSNEGPPPPPFTDQQKKRCVHGPITFTQTSMDKHINIHAKFKPKLITALATKKKSSCHCVVLDHAYTIQSLLPFLGWSTLTLRETKIT